MEPTPQEINDLIELLEITANDEWSDRITQLREALAAGRLDMNDPAVRAELAELHNALRDWLGRHGLE